MNCINVFKRDDALKLLEELNEYDVVSFDVFDTLILRPFNQPKDLFRLLSLKYNMVNFYNMRVKAEEDARKKQTQKYGHREVTIDDIYQELFLQAHIPVSKGVRTEFDLEKQVCYANPYMKKIYDELVKLGKKIIIVTDMYFPKKYIEQLLCSCGYTNYEKLYVSCEYFVSKKQGELFAIINQEYPNKRVIHVGDNIISDVQNPQKYGWTTYYYKRNADIENIINRFEFSSTIGSLYNGIVKNKFNNGIVNDLLINKYYQYGYLYSGILILGYVNFIHDYAKHNNITKILFLARDGYILKKVYDKLYSDIDSEYVLWSRHATLKTSPEKDLKRYIFQFLTRPLKSNKSMTVEEVLKIMNIEFLEEQLTIRNIDLKDIITPFIKNTLITLIEQNIDRIIKNHKEIKEAAKQYYCEKIGDSKNICIVDIGYRGSGAIALKELFLNDWNLNLNIKTFIAYGYSNRSGSDDTFILNKDIISYVFSDDKNIYLSKKFQDTNLLLNIAVIDILISSAPKPSFYYFDYDDNGNIRCHFEKEDRENYKTIDLLHQGVLDFVHDYVKACGNNLMLLNIPGKDAHEPLNHLFEKERLEVFIDDFKNFVYSLLVSGAENKDERDLLTIYFKVTKESKRKFLVKLKKKIHKNIGRFTIFKVCKRLKRIVRNDVLTTRFYYTKYYEKLRIKNNTILLQSYGGNGFYGNPYYMLNELLKIFPNYKYYIGVDSKFLKQTNKFIKSKKFKNVNLVVINSRKYCKILASAKYLINNRGFASYFIKKDEQIYIQTWHGTPLKGLGKDAKDAPDDAGNFQKNCFMTDYFIMPNEYSLNKIKKGYMFDRFYDGEYLLSGYPRNVIFLDKDLRNIVRDKLGINSKKVIAYMPTWRRSKLKDVSLEPEVVEFFDRFERENNGDSVLYVKLHSLLKDKVDLTGYKNIKEFPEEYETYEFLNIADCLVTDYSSVFFDFALSRRKVILFAYDKEKYYKSISTYFKLDELPFPIVETADELMVELNSEKMINYPSEFIHKYISLENQNTAKEVCGYIFKQEVPSFEIIKSDSQKDNILVYLGNLFSNDVLENFYELVDNNVNKNIVATFNKNKVRKNKLIINSFSNKVDFIATSGSKVMTIAEGIAIVLYKRFNVNNNWVLSKLSKIYKREVKRRYGFLSFDKVIDLSLDSIDNVSLYKYMNVKDVYFILHKSFLIPSKGKKVKKLILNNGFENVYLNNNGILSKISFDSLGRIKIGNEKIYLKDLLNKEM